MKIVKGRKKVFQYFQKFKYRENEMYALRFLFKKLYARYSRNSTFRYLGNEFQWKLEIHINRFFRNLTSLNIMKMQPKICSSYSKE